MNRIFRDFISLFYPRNCINCRRTLLSKEEYLCLHCKLNLPTTNFHQDPSNPVKNHLRTIGNLDTVFAYLSFNRLGVAQKLLHEIKYKDQEALAATVGEWFGHHIKHKVETCRIDSIVPIPLHKNKLKRRGYNQSELIAEGMSLALDIPCETDLLKRAKFTSTQTKKGKTERWVNVKDIFVINKELELENKHLLLVDDVITTGATIESAASTLNAAGMSKVSIGCIATGRK